jgi:hypothetical protein
MLGMDSAVGPLSYLGRILGYFCLMGYFWVAKQRLFGFLVISFDHIWLFVGYFLALLVILGSFVCGLYATFIYYFGIIWLYGIFEGLSNNLLAYYFVFSALF